MLLLQVLAFLVGMAALFATSFTLLPPAQLHPFAGDATLLLMCAGILAFAAGYFFFAIGGYRIGRSAWRRALAAVIVLAQLAAGSYMVYLYSDPAVLAVMGPLLCFSVYMFACFVWPATRNRAYRPLRRREGSDDINPRK
ncbi:hypothetical protein IV454_13235 [Massilia antarctica]|uniref:Integral membrane protein n=1 Tax=Massilia antarctica TaxID=2765360 RepID=A0AA48WJM8_9BURK|nr:hypothetical protein [Massilia antarctica]QPI52360.1 hypothetical protein IV454_13235 [Massilia antarctica]